MFDLLSDIQGYRFNFNLHLSWERHTYGRTSRQLPFEKFSKGHVHQVDVLNIRKTDSVANDALMVAPRGLYNLLDVFQ